MTSPPTIVSGEFTLGDRSVKRMGYGAMQLAGPGVFGPPKDPDGARAVLREAIARGDRLKGRLTGGGIPELRER